MQIYKNLKRLLARNRLVLASGSPRRVGLLKENGIPFRQIVPDIDENDGSVDDPIELTMSLAERKARTVRDRAGDDEVILGCDTIVILRGRILGKPCSDSEAFDMLTLLSGNLHTVCSAISLLRYDSVSTSGFELTDVYFNKLTPGQIERYIQSGEPLDKAGAYGIQEKGAFLVDRIEGNIDNVIGLPMTLLDRLASEIASMDG